MTDPYLARQRARALKVVMAADVMTRRIGRTDVYQVQQTVLSNIAECGALWQALADHGIVSEAERQDYLDAGVARLLAKAEGNAMEIVVHDG